uniref:Cytochrome c oxidase subunit 2 n=1 Tax=Microcosmus sulcatus TaxID=341086 RepID=D2YVG2_9ASCI|nr:cytochrome c oxidase subunit II [Microcosmus sulcatus]CAL23085.2 cytochrome c oxidase subunit II [Microcosmus sulcatus]
MTGFNSLLLQDSMNMAGAEIVLFHDYAMLLMSLILMGFVVFSLMVLKTGSWFVKGYGSSEMLEISWTMIPGFLLYSLGVPSLFLMYYIEGNTKYDLTLKVTGHQWYWSYEVSEYGGEMSFDSYMINDEDLQVGGYRLLDVDNSVVLPYLSKIRVLVTSGDVLHAWALPSMGMKIDAIPGRLNFMNIMSFRPSSVYGQCSEICGVNHSFMPIHIEFVGWEGFLNANVA